MSASAQSIWALVLLGGCALPCVHMTRAISTRAELLAFGGLAGLAFMCARDAFLYLGAG